MLCTHNTTTYASLDYCHKLTNPYLHQFSSISGGNCITRRIRSLQEPLSKVRSGKSGDLKPICLGISSPETTWKPCNLTLKTRIANGMMPLCLKWNPCQNRKYSKSGIKQSLINIRKSKILLKVIIGSKFI